MSLSLKKIFLSIGSLFILSSFAFTQEETASEAPAPSAESSSGSKSTALSMRIGFDVTGDAVLGNLADFIAANIGGQAAYEIDFLSIKNMKLGASVRAGFDYNIVKGDVLDSCCSMVATGGMFLRVPVKAVFIQPELDYGVQVFFPTKKSDAKGELDSAYCDQIIQLACNVRIPIQKVKDGSLEINVAPVYTMDFESGSNINHYIGGRVGVYYKIK